MGTHEFEARLTPAAREVLNETVGDYKSKLLLRAHAHAASLTGEVREIAVRDIVAGATNLREAAHTSRSRRASAVAQLYILTGLVMATVGVSIYLAPYITESSFSLLEILPLAVGLAGLLLGILGVALAKRSELHHAERIEAGERGEPDRFEATGLFLARWQEFEIVLRSIIADQYGESTAGAPLSELLSKLERQGVLRPEFQPVVRRVLHLRNRMVHNQVQVPLHVIMDATRDLNRLLGDLRERRPPRTRTIVDPSE